MDINEAVFKDEASNFIMNLQKLLPKKKDIIFFDSCKPNLTKLSDVHAESKSVFPQCFIGAKLVVLREIMDKVKLMQSYSYGQSREPYKCYTRLLNKETDTKDVHDGLLIDSTGSATAVYNEKMGDYQMRLMSKIKDLVSSEAEITFERESEKSVSSFSCSMKDVDPMTLRLVTQLMYKVVSEFSVGCECGLRPLSYPLSPQLSFSARYVKPTFTMSSTVSRTGFQVCLFKEFTSDLRLATIINESNKGSPASVGLALHKSYENGSELKVFVDSQQCGGFTYQRDLRFYEPHNEFRVIRLVASTLIDRQRRVRFGFGFNLDF